MGRFSFKSERQFFEGIALTLNEEKKEMAKNSQDSIDEIPVSLNRDARLTKLLDNYKSEIDYNLISCTSNQQKREVLSKNLSKAKEYKESWQFELSKYSQEPNTPFWKVSATKQQLTFINRFIEFLQIKDPEISSDLKLKDIFDDKNNAYQVCIDLMEDLEITNQGRPIMTPKNLYRLKGLIIAIKETPGMLKLNNPSNIFLLKYFNAHLNTEYSSFSKRGPRFDESLDDAKTYIKTHFKR